ncbi:MAG TPA: type II toxin-antitoxin system VapC family toxin [Verrucomicrobiae bacterium]|nr:type II toxin-antitoxin system VapC family toxin [Verrucomicrobiae bacterium]
MVTAVDTNVLVALWSPADELNERARAGLYGARARGGLVIVAAVYAELLSAPHRTEAFIDTFCAEAGIAVDWNIREGVWRAAGRAFQQYSRRRQRHGHGAPRRILADFLIGAHALQNGFRLLTLDDRVYSAAFPRLPVVTI